MNKDYVKEDIAKRKFTTQGMWALIIFILLFLSVLGRFAIRRASNGGLFFNTMPSSNDAFEVSKDFIRSTLKSSGAEFASGQFECAKGADSTYVVKSFFDADGLRTHFVIKLKYTGGDNLDDHSWTMLYLQQ